MTHTGKPQSSTNLRRAPHRTAAEHNAKGITQRIWHSERALEYSDPAYKLAKEAHDKSGQRFTR